MVRSDRLGMEGGRRKRSRKKGLTERERAAIKRGNRRNTTDRVVITA